MTKSGDKPVSEEAEWLACHPLHSAKTDAKIEAGNLS